VTGATALAEALERGGRVEWTPAERPRVLVPRSLRPKIEADRETVREVLRRAVIFRRQAGEPGPVPFLHLPECPESGPGCLSCGAALPPGRWCRCEVCEVAVRIALEFPTRAA
jgi:hypothetical protein